MNYPNPVDMDALLALDGPEFLLAAYHSILGRGPDSSGMNLHLSALTDGRLSKLEIVLALAESMEGKSRSATAPFPGLSRFRWRQRISRIPILGRLLGLARLLLPFSLLDRHRDALGCRLRMEIEARERIESQVLEMRNMLIELSHTRSLALTLNHERHQSVAALSAQMLDFNHQRFVETQRIDANLESKATALRDLVLQLNHERHLAILSILDQIGAIEDAIHVGSESVMELGSRLKACEQSLATQSARLTGVETRTDVTDKRVRSTEAHIQTIVERQEQESRRTTHALAQVVDAQHRIAPCEAKIRAMGERQEALEISLQIQVGKLGDLEAGVAHQVEAEAGLLLQSQTLEHRLAAMTSVVDRIALAQAPLSSSDATQAQLDRVYAAIEARLRGSMVDIHNRVAVYRPHLVAAVSRTGLRTVADIGCGRGEWLELIAEDCDPIGIDLNKEFVEALRIKGQRAELNEGCAWLESQPEDNLAVVSVFHVVEHLPIDRIWRLIRASYRALAPGGLLMIETPDSSNLQVGANTFWLDPTHLRPVPRALLEVLVAEGGFTVVGPLHLHTDGAALSTVIGDTDARARINLALHGPQDLGLISIKPGGRS